MHLIHEVTVSHTYKNTATTRARTYLYGAEADKLQPIVDLTGLVDDPRQKNSVFPVFDELIS